MFSVRLLEEAESPTALAVARTAGCRLLPVDLPSFVARTAANDQSEDRKEQRSQKDDEDHTGQAGHTSVSHQFDDHLAGFSGSDRDNLTGNS